MSSLSNIAPTRRQQLMVLEDDPVTGQMIAAYFSEHAFDVTVVDSCKRCRELLRNRAPDLLFVDIQLPDGDGIELAQEIRAASQVGIIFVTRRNSDADRIRGLEAAGDHYVTKPIDLRDLLARSRSLLRRRTSDGPAPAAASTIRFRDWTIDLVRRELTAPEDMQINLTRGEFDLLAALVDARGRALTREYLIEVISNRHAEVDIRTVDALVARLRRKLISRSERPVIATVTGVGYKLVLEE
ncbi:MULTISPECIES: response regulator transcription factor [Bradyrhizobium]|uniref:response regulator transcription factor n=1 Tax=Bradyrhizobium TaxID=374 RepID=UPI00286834AD|nr:MULTISPECIES: response regulator transcription factor [Bradyrhizobium]